MKNNSIILELFNKNITQIFKNQEPLSLIQLKNDNNNLLNTLADKLPVFSQSFIEETQKTPNKINEEINMEIKD
ncbi:MAG: hypothetical protein IIT78_03210 [Mycoplasmataceae bacterium]|nr:hypothetical protein [Mycoplasmataceae bacterium]